MRLNCCIILNSSVNQVRFFITLITIILTSNSIKKRKTNTTVTNNEKIPHVLCTSKTTSHWRRSLNAALFEITSMNPFSGEAGSVVVNNIYTVFSCTVAVAFRIRHRQINIHFKDSKKYNCLPIIMRIEIAKETNTEKEISCRSNYVIERVIVFRKIVIYASVIKKQHSNDTRVI